MLRGFAKIMRDDTEVKRGEEAHDDAWAYVRSIVETAREPLVILDCHLRVQSANHAFYQTFQVSPQDAHDQLLYELGNRQWDIPRLRTLLEEILPHDTAFNDYKVEHDFPAIGRKVMLLNARMLQQGGAELILLAIEDVTERRRAEAERHEIETRFTSLVKNVQDHAIFTLDPEGRVTSWNVAAEQVLGYTEGEALGQPFAFIFTPEDRQQSLPEAELRAARQRGCADDERWHLRKGGDRFWALGNVSPLRDAEGRLTGFSKILRDMTQWKRAEQELRASEERRRQMLNVDAVGVLIFDGSGTLVAANDAFLRITGYAREEVEARALTWRVMTPPEHIAESERQMHLLAETGRLGPYEKEYFRKDGSRLWMLFAGASLGDGTVVEYCVDVDDRRRAEEALRESRQQLALVLEVGQLGFWDWEMPSGRVHYGGRWAAMLGYDASEIEPHFHSWEKLTHPDERTAVMAALSDHLDGRTDLYECTHRLRHKDGSWRWILSRGQVVKRDVEGRPLRAVGTHADVTALREAESALREADSRKDEFLATLAHELRNPLASIRTGLDLAKALRGDAAACEEPLRIMDRQLNHLVHLVDDLLDVSRISRGKIQLRKERLDLSEIIDAAVEMSDSMLSRNDRHLTVSVPSEPLVVEGDRVRLVQIVFNLLNNAAKYTDADGHIALRVVPEGERLEIRVRDDGHGIPPERLAEIFEPFVQAEPGRGGGLGIGLTLVRSLVTTHGGSVSAYSEGLGRGASFTVSLPLCRSVPRQPVRHEATETRPVPLCHVLVVDDNRDIAEGLRLILTLLEAEVRVAHDGAEALRICEDWKPTHVLMDIGMPGMDGYEAARRLRAKHPDSAFRLIAVTGWGQDEDRQRALEAGFDEHLVKPVGVQDLKAVLSR